MPLGPLPRESRLLLTSASALLGMVAGMYLAISTSEGRGSSIPFLLAAPLSILAIAGVVLAIDKARSGSERPSRGFHVTSLLALSLGMLVALLIEGPAWAMTIVGVAFLLGGGASLAAVAPGTPQQTLEE